MPDSIRVGANAVIIRNDHILLVEFNDDSGLHYNLPGGGVKPGEALYEAVAREVREETCADVLPQRLLLVYEYVPARYSESVRSEYGLTHKLGLIFACRLRDNSEPAMPANPDENQTGVRWVSLDALPETRLLPSLTDRILQAVDLSIDFNPFCADYHETN